MNTRPLGPVLLLSMATFSAHASEEAWTLGSVVNEALVKNPSLKEAREKIEESEAAVAKSKAGLFPSVDATLTANTQKDAANTTLAKPRFDGNNYNLYSLSLKATQPLFAWGIFSAIRSPRRDKEISGLDLQLKERDLLGGLIKSFYKLLLSERYVETLRHNEAIQKESLSTAERRKQSGRGQYLDVLQVKTQLALLAPKIAKAQKDAAIASAQLASLMGEASMQSIRVRGQLDVLSFTDIRKVIDLQHADLPEYKKVIVSQQKLSADQDVIIGKNLPKLNAVGTWGRSSVNQSGLYDGNTTAWTLGLELSIPLFSGFSSFDERHSYASKKAQLEYEEQNVSNDLAFKQIQSQKNLEVAESNIASSETAFELADDSLKEAKRNYQYANIDFLQYLSVQQAYLEAASSLDEAKYTYIESLVNYFSASGQPLSKLIELLKDKKT